MQVVNGERVPVAVAARALSLRQMLLEPCICRMAVFKNIVIRSGPYAPRNYHPQYGQYGKHGKCRSHAQPCTKLPCQGIGQQPACMRQRKLRGEDRWPIGRRR